MPVHTPDFEYRSAMPIFRIWPSGDLLALELRDSELKMTAFTVINTQTHQILADAIGLEEPWWCSIAGLSETHLYLQTLKKTDFPDPEMLYAIRLSDMEIVWEQPEKVVAEVNNEHVSLWHQEGEERVYSLANAASGHLQRLSEVPPLAVSDASSPHFPTQNYQPGHTYHHTVTRFLQRHLSSATEGCIDYIERPKDFLTGCKATDMHFMQFTKSGDVRLHFTMPSVVAQYTSAMMLMGETWLMKPADHLLWLHRLPPA